MTTASKTVLLTGTSPLYSELLQLLKEKGYRVVSLAEMAENRTEIRFAVEVTNLDLELKKAAIRELDGKLPANVPILTTSLAITATEVASWTQCPARVCGFGTLVPLAERELIEIAPALQTAPSVLEQAEAFLQSMGKQTEVVVDEIGLVFPRILSLIINEAAFTVMERTATAQDIDTAMKKGTNYPYGPLEWADQIGLDDVYAIIRGLHRDLGEERYRPAPLLRKLVLAGRVGKRSNQGFYQYEPKEVSYR
ncbi:MAG: 3-hydroxybutyryl-CoA dehydrogenase [Brevibacillus sp.]|nr:3-hydroxybutyryl-CoA dehydrogenase [Brevibacillus sp.]